MRRLTDEELDTLEARARTSEVGAVAVSADTMISLLAEVREGRSERARVRAVALQIQREAERARDEAAEQEARREAGPAIPPTPDEVRALVAEVRESRERLAHYEKLMQVREAFERLPDEGPT